MNSLDGQHNKEKLPFDSFVLDKSLTDVSNDSNIANNTKDSAFKPIRIDSINKIEEKKYGVICKNNAQLKNDLKYIKEIINEHSSRKMNGISPKRKVKENALFKTNSNAINYTHAFTPVKKYMNVVDRLLTSSKKCNRRLLEKRRVIEEMQNCTFRPAINRIQTEKILSHKKRRKSLKSKKVLDDINCTFHPKICLTSDLLAKQIVQL